MVVVKPTGTVRLLNSNHDWFSTNVPKPVAPMPVTHGIVFKDVHVIKMVPVVLL